VRFGAEQVGAIDLADLLGFQIGFEQIQQITDQKSRCL
jgi:hypothetical protein